jgi:hypothetical protein
MNRASRLLGLVSRGAHGIQNFSTVAEATKARQPSNKVLHKYKEALRKYNEEMHALRKSVISQVIYPASV